MILSPTRLEMLLSKDESISEDSEFYGWYIECDTNDGSFDAEKGAMTDFKIRLYDDENKLRATGRGGYYTAITGVVFNYDIEFTEHVPKYTFRFSKALTLLHSNQRLQRKGWNGKGMYIYLVPENSYDAQTKVAKKEFGDKVPCGAFRSIVRR